MNPIEEYNAGIQKGIFIVPNKIRKVYQHLAEKLKDKESRYVYDDSKAQYAIGFIEHFCRQSKGKWAGKLVVLELWQKAFIAPLFGFVDKQTGLREYRELMLLIGRKNGKSLIAAALGVYLLIADGEGGPEIYSAATKRDQAKIIWKEAVRMIKKSPALRKRCRCLVGSIETAFNNGSFVPLGSDSNTLDGLNVHGALIDELHEIKDRNLYDVIIDGMSAREQPLSIITSTAGTLRDNIFDIKYNECRDIINGYDDPNGYQDETVLPIVYELDDRKEWTDPKMWVKANPGLGVIKNYTSLEQKVKKAKVNPLLVKNLLCKDFNIRETAAAAFLTFEELNNEAVYDMDALKPRYGIGGADLSQTVDLTCATLLFQVQGDPVIYVRQMYWIPEELFDKRMEEDNVPYDIWYKQGLLRKSPGRKIDYRLVTQWFEEIRDTYDIYLFRVGYDGWSATYWVQEMTEHFGEPVMDRVIQGAKTLSAPMKSLKADLQAKNVNYNNNPVLKWCMANTSVIEDRNGNIVPCKMNSRQRIDGFASLLDAYVSWQRNYRDYTNII